METSRHRRQVEVMEPAYKLLTVEDFLDCCPSDQRHYQLFDGIIVAMAPPGGRHQRIAGVLGGALYNAVQSKLPACAVLVQAGIAPHGMQGRNYFETDLTVTCEPQRDDHRGIVREPLLIVEYCRRGPIATMFSSSSPLTSVSPACRKSSMSKPSGSERSSIAAPRAPGRP